MPGFIFRLSILFHWSIFLFLHPNHILFITVAFHIVWSQGAWFLQLCFSFSRLLWLFMVFCVSIQIVNVFVLFLWKMLLLGLTLFSWNSLNLKVKVAQWCPMLCDPMHYRRPGYFVHGILQARILEWVAILFSRGSSQPRDWTQVPCIAGRSFTVWATREAQE